MKNNIKKFIKYLEANDWECYTDDKHHLNYHKIEIQRVTVLIKKDEEPQYSSMFYNFCTSGNGDTIKK